MKRRFFVSMIGSSVCLSVRAQTQKRYGPGASDTEIRLGQTMPYSGHLSALGNFGRVQLAYFQMLNDTEGGVSGRRVNLLSRDDGYSPPKTVEAVRELVERDEVLGIIHPVGTASNKAIHRYMNQKKVPQLLVLSGAQQWNDPKANPWTMMGMIAYHTEGAIYAKHFKATVPQGKMTVLMQNDDFGKDYLGGLLSGLGSKQDDLVLKVTYETSDPTIDSQIIAMQRTRAEGVFLGGTGKFVSLALKKIHELGWRPQIYLPIGSASVGGILKPAGLDAAKGVITAANAKSPGDPAWDQDIGMRGYFDFLKRWAPAINPNDSFAASGFSYAQIIVQILKQCGDHLTRENLMRQASNLKGFSSTMMLPGVTVDTSSDDYLPFQKLRLQQFDGSSYKLIGELMEV
jgi:branched-chain amino acid transport system substrate-binding protein